ncbi:lanthionine synthetase LanC family protein [Nocardioides hankookensis]|uniref:Lanthionine synthetase LanC family protein n=1 Tax=Nocardioides hankookensis TaxID=443157 RepID=A0ABW1LHB0_9ACTN
MTTEELAEAALAWLAAQPLSDDPDLYSGTAGIVVSFVEAHTHTADDRWADLAVAGARSLAMRVDALDHHSLYFGTTGIAVVLREIGERYDDAPLVAAADRGRDVVRAAFDGERWGEAYDLMGGNAGIGLGALRLGDPELALLAVEPYLHTSERTAYGITWENRVGLTARRHHISHGTLGIAYGLVAVGGATGRSDLVDLGLEAVADVVARNEEPDGFLVPHSDPAQVHPLLERYSLGWCHGPTGDAQVFRLLHEVTGQARWLELQDRCWHTVVTSGLPERLRPGFWDNNGRCCGTAGVLALASDRQVERGDDASFADRLVADLTDRATIDAAGARWSNREHRAAEPDLPPQPGWAMGNAGIVRELLRHDRIATGRDPAYAFAWPDQPVAT